MRFKELKESIQLPITSFEALYHTGTMDASKKQSDSHEGAGLSVTIEDAIESWQHLARATGDVWKLSKNGNKFIDYHNLSEDHKKLLIDWGVNNGWVSVEEQFYVTWFDDEMNQELTTSFDSYEEAFIEADEQEDLISSKQSPVATDKTNQRTGHNVAVALLPDILSTFYAEDVLNIDGVWWDDDHDVSRYSAPRGVIVPSKISTWQASKI